MGAGSDEDPAFFFPFSLLTKDTTMGTSKEGGGGRAKRILNFSHAAISIMDDQDNLYS